MKVKPRPFGEPVPDRGGFVRAVVVRDDVNLQCGGHLRLDHIQKVTKLAGAVAMMKLTNHMTGFQLQRGKQ